MAVIENFRAIARPVRAGARSRAAVRSIGNTPSRRINPRIEPITVSSNASATCSAAVHPPTRAGAVVGGIASGVLGHQIGSGRGNTAATIAGAIGEALVGNEIEKRSRREDEDYRISVRLDDGSYRTVIVAENSHLRVGDRQLRKAITATMTAIVSTMPLG